MSQIPEFARDRLRQQRAGDHPDADILTAFAERSLSGAERDRVLSHLAACSTCREVAALVSAAVPQPAPVPGRRFPSNILGWPVLHWGALAAAVVVIAAAVIVIMPSRMRFGTSDLKTAEPEAVTTAEPSPRPSPAIAARKDTAREESTPATPEHAATKPKTKMMERDRLSTLANAVREQRANSEAEISGRAEPMPPLTDTAPAERKGMLAGAAAPAQENAAPKPQSLGAARISGGQQQIVAQSTPTQKRSAGAPPPPAVAAAPMMSRADAVAGTAKSQLVSSVAKPVRWRVSDTGSLERLTPTGWQPAPIAGATGFRAVSALGSDVWAAGTGGMLWHSSDAGITWEKLPIRDGGTLLTLDIVRVEFVDKLHGSIATPAGEVWTTEDGGRTWTRR